MTDEDNEGHADKESNIQDDSSKVDYELERTLQKEDFVDDYDSSIFKGSIR